MSPAAAAFAVVVFESMASLTVRWTFPIFTTTIERTERSKSAGFWTQPKSCCQICSSFETNWATPISFTASSSKSGIGLSISLEPTQRSSGQSDDCVVCYRRELIEQEELDINGRNPVGCFVG